MTVRKAHRAAQRAASPYQATASQRRRWRYRLTVDEAQALFERAAGKCEVCREDLGDDACVDHDHETGRVRGMLCRGCNLGLGWFRDDPRRLLAAVEYLAGG